MFCSLSAGAMSLSFVMAGYLSSQVDKYACAVGLDNLVQIAHVRLHHGIACSSECVDGIHPNSASDDSVTPMSCVGHAAMHLFVVHIGFSMVFLTMNMRELVTQF